MFTIRLQFAHHESSESDDSQASASEVLTAFDNYEWEKEIRKSQELQRCSPTISVEAGERLIWFSGVGNPESPSFISECAFPGVVRKWFGLANGHGLVSLYVEGLSVARARTALQYFIQKNGDGLRALYAEA